MAQSKWQQLTKALAAQVEPILQELGFVGEFPKYTRQLGDRLDIVWFLGDRAGNIGIEIKQLLPDGTWPLQPEHGPAHKDKVAGILAHKLGSIPEWGWLHRSTQGWIKTGHKDPALFPAVAAECITRLLNEAEPWFAARPVHQCQELIHQVMPALRERGFTVGDFPEVRRLLRDRIDLIGFYFSERGRLVIEVAQVLPDGSGGYNGSPRLRRRLRETGSAVIDLFSRVGLAGDRPPAERALAMIRKEAEPWFRSRPVYR